MTVFVPEMPDLVRAAVDHLEQDLLPTLTGYQRFHTRVCVTVLRIVQRQMAQGGALEADEWARLRELLGSQDALPVLNRRLMDALDDGSLSLDAPGLVPHLRATLEAALQINNPRWTLPPVPTTA